MKKHLGIIILTVLAAILIFSNLGNQYLWQDEAETAALAENTLKYGFPRAYDGKNLINPRIRTGFSENYGWRYHPWGQFYITALSFKLFGVNTFTARLPFAVLGVLNTILLYILVLKLTEEKFVANCSVILTIFSVPYLLLMRQCRYYAPAVFLVLFILLFYSEYYKRGKFKDLILFLFGLIALGYTVHGMFVPVYAAIGLHYLIFYFKKETALRTIIGGLIPLILVIPWFMYSNSSSHTAPISLEKVMDNLEFLIRMTNKFIFPVVFFLIVYGVRVLWKRKFSFNLKAQEKDSLKIIGMVIVVSIAAFSFAEERNFRYLVYFIPLLAIVQSIILLRLFNVSRILLVAFLFISITTGIFNMGYPQVYFPKYLYEITHDYDGPIEGIVKFLNKNAKEGDTVKIIYGDHSLIFYTDLKVDNSWVYDEEHMPEWIVFRRNWHEQLDDRYYSVVKKKYKKHTLNYPDIRYENRPGDLGYHRFWTDKEAPRVILFERIKK